eukprot:1100771-Amphidinium_carterae.1
MLEVVQVENKRSEAVTGTGSASRPRMKARPPVPDALVTTSVPEVPKFKGPSAIVGNPAPVTSPLSKKAPPQMPG